MAQRLALVIHALSHGGAERVLADLASYWATHGREVTLITLARVETDTYPLPPSVRRIGLDLQRESRTWWERLRNHRRRVRALREALMSVKPDAIVSFTEKSNILTLQAAQGLQARVIIAERTDPRHHQIGRGWAFLRQRLYPRADLLVVQTEGVASYCHERFRCPIQVIPNAAPVVAPDLSKPVTGEKRLMAVGRLDPHKQFDRVIRIFSRLWKQFPEWRLQIVGTGPEEGRLRDLIREMRLEEAVELTGWVSEILPVLQQGDLFVSASTYEGFPNALLEAMACGLPAICFDCESGPAEIIRPGVDGLLVPNGDEAGLERALRELMRDAGRREEMGRAAREVSVHFSREKFFTAWDAVLTATSH